MSDVVYKSADGANRVEAMYRQVLEQWPVPKIELHLPTCQGETFVLVCGPEEAPPVVLLHGAQANAAVWSPDIALWSKEFRLYAIDMIGEAGLSARVRPELNSNAHALWLDDVFKGLGLEYAAIVGTSLGGLAGARLRQQAARCGHGASTDLPRWYRTTEELLAESRSIAAIGTMGQAKVARAGFRPGTRNYAC